MPKYKYRREDGEVIEVRHSISEAPLEECPDTGQPIEPIIGDAEVLYKADGFHDTDYD
jgi:predicted nucleic acid-binding Zn ribbon protein